MFEVGGVEDYRCGWQAVTKAGELGGENEGSSRSSNGTRANHCECEKQEADLKLVMSCCCRAGRLSVACAGGSSVVVTDGGKIPKRPGVLAAGDDGSQRKNRVLKRVITGRQQDLNGGLLACD